MQPENALLTTTTTPTRCTWTSIGRPNLLPHLSCSIGARGWPKSMHIYIPIWGSGVIRLKNNFSVDGQVSEIWILDNYGIYPSRLFYPSSSKRNKGTVIIMIIIRNYGATKIYELPCRKLWIIANSQRGGGCKSLAYVQRLLEKKKLKTYERPNCILYRTVHVVVVFFCGRMYNRLFLAFSGLWRGHGMGREVGGAERQLTKSFLKQKEKKFLGSSDRDLGNP